MGNQDTRNRLIQTAKRLLLNGENVESLTARKISAEAGTNLAMINYCFKSKDELLKVAVDEIVFLEFSQFANTHAQTGSAKEQLKELLLHVCLSMIKFRSLTKQSIPYLLLKEEILLPYDILPFIKKHYGNKKDETECKIIAFQIVYTMQLIFYRSEDFRKYSGLDLQNEEQFRAFLDMQLDLFLGGVSVEK